MEEPQIPLRVASAWKEVCGVSARVLTAEGSRKKTVAQNPDTPFEANPCIYIIRE